MRNNFQATRGGRASRKLGRLLLLLSFLLLAAGVCAAQGGPEVLKVEPPSWWAGHSINPVRVMVRGRNLHGARVEAVGVGLKTGLTRVNESGSYLFVDVHIEPNAAPGARRLRVSAGGATVETPFEITAPLSRQGRFQGFTTDDVIYFIMPDRFSDGDSSNNNPSKSPGLYDRTKGRHYHGATFRASSTACLSQRPRRAAIWINPSTTTPTASDEKEVYPETAGGPKRPTTAYHGTARLTSTASKSITATCASCVSWLIKRKRSASRSFRIRLPTTQAISPVGDGQTDATCSRAVENHLSNKWQSGGRWTRTLRRRPSAQPRRLV